MLSGPTIGISYPYILSIAESSCLSVGSFSELAHELGIQKRGKSSVEADEARSVTMVRKLRILRRFW